MRCGRPRRCRRHDDQRQDHEHEGARHVAAGRHSGDYLARSYFVVQDYCRTRPRGC